MKVLFVGGTGNISTTVSRMVVRNGMELYLLNRGQRPVSIEGARNLVADNGDFRQMQAVLNSMTFDVVVNWIAYTLEDIERDLALFRQKTKQYIFISSASAYQKPPVHPVITESTPLKNPFWEYSRNKIACEERLNQSYREDGFPITIVRPSLTYDTVIPVAIGSWTDYTIIDRIKKGQPIIVHGDGSSLWTITHADDFARGFLGLLGNIQAIGHAFHITSDEILTWNQIYHAVAGAAGCEANLVHIPSDFISDVAESLGQSWMRGNLLGDKACSVIFDNSKIKRFVPGFTAVIPFAQGFKRTLAWFEADPSRKTIVDSNNQLIDAVVQAYKRT
jgi:nucleoside-diphosphate-sugar epimerase